MATGSPNFAITPVLGVGLVGGTGDTSLTAPTHGVTILSGGTSGTRIERIVFCAAGTTTATSIRLFIYNGTTYSLWYEGIVPANTITAGSNTAWQTTLEAVTTPYFMPLLLPNGSSLVGTCNDTQTPGINVFAIGGNF